MPILLLFLVLLFVAPWAFGLLLVFFLIFLLVFIPLGFAAQSFIWLIVGPGQLLRILFNKKVRRNHALEHATVNVIEENYGPTNIAGMAYENGFTLKGVMDPHLVLAAAREGLYRMSRGERKLAVHPRCGTTIVVTNTVAAAVFVGFLFLTGHLSLFSILLAILCAHAFGAFFSKIAQYYITTSQDVSGMMIDGIEVRSNPVNFLGMKFMMPSELFISTRQPEDGLSVEVVD
ncbi:DUF6391 domain-containing protein [Acetomicrobium hydrogeniformans]|uniref:Uncharacterized protein n=1 Tax=Acetomicrobium hydrogeniformans TaxID=649746 RepID=A0A7V7BXQ0_9BACT|nr:DUF6391 domain-containing protein [Acetomicrobium hydrogeniformans]HHZ03781.1 hypothetical protein [Acetomicrobium hydrogeniformans]